MTDETQTYSDGSLRHLLTLENLSADIVGEILDRAESFYLVMSARLTKSRYYLASPFLICFLKIVLGPELLLK